MYRLSTSVLALFVAVACVAQPSNEASRVTRNAAHAPALRDVPPGAQARSLLGEALFAPPLSALEQARRLSALHAAQRAWELAPHDADATLWLGRRLGYLGRFREALDVFTLGVREFPDDARLLRHRGHRLISVREFELATQDLERAAALVAGRDDEVEPDGQPNASGVQLETLQSNIHYHLGLARYLNGDFERAAQAFRDALALSTNADNRCSASHWLCTSLRRGGHAQQALEVAAAIRADLAIVEYHSYHQLCLVYQGTRDADELLAEARAKGLASTDFATIGFGVGAWHLSAGRSARARAIFSEVCSAPTWHAFGHIAAEAELARLPSLASDSATRRGR
jgi:tetratricopeptide (TPR) repeat protein